MAKRSLILLTSIVVLVVCTTTGCVTSPTPTLTPSTTTANAASLEGTQWTLTSLRTKEGTTGVLPNTTITAAFKSGVAAGSSGCNHYWANYTLSGRNNITFTPLVSTAMECRVDVSTQEIT